MDGSEAAPVSLVLFDRVEPLDLVHLHVRVLHFADVNGHAAAKANPRLFVIGQLNRRTARGAKVMIPPANLFLCKTLGADGVARGALPFSAEGVNGVKQIGQIVRHAVFVFAAEHNVVLASVRGQGTVVGLDQLPVNGGVAVNLKGQHRHRSARCLAQLRFFALDVAGIDAFGQGGFTSGFFKRCL